MKPLLSLTDTDINFPFWKTEDKGEYLLKVNDKWLNSLSDLVPKIIYNIHCDFEYYNMDKDNTNIKGYCKVPKVKRVVSEDVEQNDEN